MSGDVQPRKRKDKKRRKDELGVEEPRGTAAALGEGDVFIHSHHDHGTGGHWCAKIIFFSLLAVLITLIGLIILENRGLTELEANSVESRYSGVLEGWLEDAPEDDHHDDHTLELNHPDDDDEDLHGHDDDEELDHDDEELDHDDDDEHEDEDHGGLDEHEDADEDENEDEDANDSEDENDDGEDELYHSDNNDDDDEESNAQQDVADSQEENEEDEQEDQRNYNDDEDDETQNGGDENDDNELQEVDESVEDNERQTDNSDEDDRNDSTYNDIDGENESEEEVYHEEEITAFNEDEEEHEEEEDTEIEIERIEREIDLEPISSELPALPEEEDNDKSEVENGSGNERMDGHSNEQRELVINTHTTYGRLYRMTEMSTEIDDQDKEDTDDGVAPEDLDDDYLVDDSDEPPIEHITAPVGKPLIEVEEEESSETPPDTLAEEEEYEKQQEEKKREEEKSSHMWLKLSVGGALLVATHAVVRRATAPREAPAEEERSDREETPLIDRRMTLIPQESIPVPRISTQSYAPPASKEEIIQKAPIITQQTSLPQEEEDEEDEEKLIEDDEMEVVPSVQDTEDKELYSDEEVEEEEEIEVKKEAPKLSAPKPEEKVVEPEPDPEEDPDDVEIIDDEQLEEEAEEEDDEEEISDVDDAELLSRLEAKYGRLPEPERPGQKHKDGGNSIEDEWPGEPSDSFWRQELDSAEDELRRGLWPAAARRASAPELRGSGRARWLAARAADLEAEARRDNGRLGLAIAAYLDLLKMNEKLSDQKLREVTARTLDRIMFRGNYLSAEPVYRLLIRRFPEEVGYRNNLTISFLMANRADLAEEILKETLKKWPNDRVALAHYGFVLKTLRNRLEEAVEAFQKALDGDTGPANEPRFYYHLGDALLLLGRPAEAHEVHKRGAKLGHFLSPAQRSLYNVPRLKSRPWWDVDETPYAKLARALEKNWKEILNEGEAAKALYEKEKEGLKERGDWSQLDLFARGQEIPNRCKNAPVTCSIVRSEPAAVGCRRGQIKFSAMLPGTHVRPHVGPTNCRLRMHLALSNTKDTFIRVDQTVRQWKIGKVFMFDDSFEHEVWHNGSGTRLVLIVDVWHPDLTSRERRSLPAI